MTTHSVTLTNNGVGLDAACSCKWKAHGKDGEVRQAAREHLAEQQPAPRAKPVPAAGSEHLTDAQSPRKGFELWIAQIVNARFKRLEEQVARLVNETDPSSPFLTGRDDGPDRKVPE